jgi:hypothetical protein
LYRIVSQRTGRSCCARSRMRAAAADQARNDVGAPAAKPTTATASTADARCRPMNRVLPTAKPKINSLSTVLFVEVLFGHVPARAPTWRKGRVRGKSFGDEEEGGPARARTHRGMRGDQPPEPLCDCWRQGPPPGAPASTPTTVAFLPCALAMHTSARGGPAAVTMAPVQPPPLRR